MRAKVLILGLICFFIFTCCKSPSDPEIEEGLTPNVVMIYGPTGLYLFDLYSRPQYEFHVSGGVKNIGNRTAFNAKVSIEVWTYGGTLLFSGETIVGDGKLEPQQYVEWLIKFNSADDVNIIIAYRNTLKDKKYEIRYEITWGNEISQLFSL